MNSEVDKLVEMSPDEITSTLDSFTEINDSPIQRTGMAVATNAVGTNTVTPESDIKTNDVAGEIVVQETLARQTWSSVVSELKNRLDPQIFNAWINPLDFVVSEDQSIEIITPNHFCCEHVQKYYGKLIVDTLKNSLGTQSLKVKFCTCDAAKSSSSASYGDNTSSLYKSESIHNIINKITVSKTPRDNVSSERKGFDTPNGHSKLESGKNDSQTDGPKRTIARLQGVRTRANDNNSLNPKYSFSSFVVGSCNQFAHAVSLQVSQNLGLTYNPLFIYGGVGLGKTHLVNAIGNYVTRSSKKALLVSSEVFVNELISAIRSNNMQPFKDKFRSLDLLIIDDIQFLTGKERTQEEFFHTFNELYHKRKQIVVTSDKVPQELVGLEERLRTRFASGLSADLQAPDYETRVAILSQKAETYGLSIDDDVVNFLAYKIDTNVRELEGALNRIAALSSMQNVPIDLGLAQKALKALLPDSNKELSADIIQEALAKRYNVSKNDLVGKRRTMNIALARQISMYLCRKLLGSSYPEIGAIFGGRDHSTVIHACKTIEDRFLSDQSLRESVMHIEKELVA